MSKSLRAEVRIMVEVFSLKDVLIQNGYFQDRNDEGEIELGHSNIATLKTIKQSGLEDYEIQDIDKLIKTIRRYGIVTLWLGY